jgi:hypothetical protein
MDSDERQTSGGDACTSACATKVAPSDLAPSGSTVTLNVGGRLFTTLHETLCKDPKSLLAQLGSAGGYRDSQARLVPCVNCIGLLH